MITVSVLPPKFAGFGHRLRSTRFRPCDCPRTMNGIPVFQYATVTAPATSGDVDRLGIERAAPRGRDRRRQLERRPPVHRARAIAGA